MNEEGIIKYNCTWIKQDPLDSIWIKELNIWRNKLYRANLIGVNKEGIGYGNISARFRDNTFIITGSTTGKLKKLTGKHYTLVTDYDLNENRVTTQGPIIASSESLTHAIIYECAGNINAVMHVHHLKLWKKLVDTLPSTNKHIEYGTTALAREIKRLFKKSGLTKQKIFAMGGHEEGIISFGKNFAEAGQEIFDRLIFL